MDFSTKELVNTFVYSRYGDEQCTDVRINGRRYIKTGILTGAAFVGNVWKVWDASTKTYKYVLLTGVAVQHPNDITVSKEEGYEIANEKAFSNPTINITFSTSIDEKTFTDICKVYYKTLPFEFVHTAEEVRQKQNTNICF